MAELKLVEEEADATLVEDEYYVDGGTPEDSLEETLVYDEESGNLVRDFLESEKGKDALAAITDKVVRDFEDDWESMEDFRRRVADDLRVFSGELENKTFPYEHCANAHVPIMLENLSRLQSRITSEIFGNWKNIVGVMPVGPDDEEVADILTMHTNWQFRNDIPDFPRQMDRAALGFLMIGDCTVESRYDLTRGENRHVYLTPEEFVVPYTYVSTMPDYSDLPHYTRVLRLYKHELEQLRDTWYGIDELLESPTDTVDSEPDEPIREKMAEILGEEENEDSENTPYKILQYEGWLDLPDQDTQRWCQVIVHYASRQLLSLTIHEQQDWKDRARYERESQEAEAYRMSYGMWAEGNQQLEIAKNSAQTAIEEDTEIPVDEQAVEVIAEEGQPRPPAPRWMVDPEDLGEEPLPPKMKQICMFSHGVCLENLVGATGLGMGRIEADFNRAANTALSQFTDAATLANCWTLITPRNLQFGAPFKFQPGRVNTVSGVTGSEIKNSIVELKPDPANPQLLQLVDKFYEYGQSAIQAPNVLSGEPGKSGETYRGLASRIEQATKQLTIIAHRFSVMLKQVYQNNAQLNALFMPEFELINVMNDREGRWEALQVGRALYARDYRVELISDLKFTSEAVRIQEADELVQLPAAVPALQSNLRFQYETVKKALVARGRWDLVQSLGAPPPPPDVFGMPPAAPPGQTPPGAPPGAPQAVPPPVQGPPVG